MPPATSDDLVAPRSMSLTNAEGSLSTHKGEDEDSFRKRQQLQSGEGSWPQPRTRSSGGGGSGSSSSPRSFKKGGGNSHERGEEADDLVKLPNEEHARYNAACAKEPSARTKADIDLLQQRTAHLRRLGSEMDPINHRELCRVMRHRRVEAKHMLVRKGMPAEGFFILLSGSCAAYTGNYEASNQAHRRAGITGFDDTPSGANRSRRRSYDKPTETLQPGALIGESALRQAEVEREATGKRRVQALHTATVVATETCELMELSAADYVEILRAERSFERVAGQRNALLAFLSQLPCLDGHGVAQLRRLAEGLARRSYGRNQRFLAFANPPDASLGAAGFSADVVPIIFSGSVTLMAVAHTDAASTASAANAAATADGDITERSAPPSRDASPTRFGSPTSAYQPRTPSPTAQTLLDDGPSLGLSRQRRVATLDERGWSTTNMGGSLSSTPVRLRNEQQSFRRAADAHQSFRKSAAEQHSFRKANAATERPSVRTSTPPASGGGDGGGGGGHEASTAPPPAGFMQSRGRRSSKAFFSDAIAMERSGGLAGGGGGGGGRGPTRPPTHSSLVSLLAEGRLPPRREVEAHLLAGGGRLLPVAELGPGEMIIGNVFSDRNARWCLAPSSLSVEVLLVPRKELLDSLKRETAAAEREQATAKAAFFGRRLAQLAQAQGGINALTPRQTPRATPRSTPRNAAAAVAVSAAAAAAAVASSMPRQDGSLVTPDGAHHPHLCGYASAAPPADAAGDSPGPTVASCLGSGKAAAVAGTPATAAPPADMHADEDEGAGWSLTQTQTSLTSCVANIRVALPAVDPTADDATAIGGRGAGAAPGRALAASPSSPTKLNGSTRDEQQQPTLPTLPAVLTAAASPPTSLYVQPYHLAMLYRHGTSASSLDPNVSSASRMQLVAGGDLADLGSEGRRRSGAAPGHGGNVGAAEGGGIAAAALALGARTDDAYGGRGLLHERFIGSQGATTPLALPHLPRGSYVRAISGAAAAASVPRVQGLGALKDDGARRVVDAANAAKKLMSPLGRAHCARGLTGKTGVVGVMGRSASAPALGHILRSTWVPRQPRSASRVADDAATVAARGGTRAGGQRMAQPTMPDEGFYMHMPGLMPPVFLENLDTRDLNG